MAEGRGLKLNSLGGGPRNPSGCCGEARLEASPQVFYGARRTRDWPRCIALHPAGIPASCSGLSEPPIVRTSPVRLTPG